jgi:hypothetical protein
MVTSTTIVFYRVGATLAVAILNVVTARVTSTTIVFYRVDATLAVAILNDNT